MTDYETVDIIGDVCTLTTIPRRSMNRLVKHENWCICEALQESQLKKESISVLDIGIGTLYIEVGEETVQYKFIPSKSLEANIVETITSGKNPLVVNLEDTFADRITKTYKDVF